MKMRLKSRVMALLLVALLCVPLTPQGVFAAGSPGPTVVLQNIAERYTDSGVVGVGSAEWFAADLAAFAAAYPTTSYKLSQVQKQAFLDYRISKVSAVSSADDLAKYIIALRALGYDATDVVLPGNSSIDLVSLLIDLVDADDPGVFDLYTLPYALIALQQINDDVQDQIDSMIEYALNSVDSSGGWDDGWGFTDMTGPIVLALSPYYSDSDVKKAIDDALTRLQMEAQAADGAIDGGWGSSAASTGLAMAAFASVGIDPGSVKYNDIGLSLLDGLLGFLNDDENGFRPGWGTDDSFDTEQGLRGLLSAVRVAATGQPYRIYDFRSNPEAQAVTNQAEYCLVDFQVIPASATIAVTKSAVPQSPISALTPKLYDLPQGTYDYSVSMAGYSTKTGSFTVSPAEETGNSRKVVQVSLASVGQAGSSGITVTVYVKTHNGGECNNSYTYKTNANKYTDLVYEIVNLPSRSSVFDALDATLAQAGKGYAEKSWGYISSIDGINEFSHGPTSGWLYMVGKTVPTTGSRDYLLTSDSTVIWFFTDDYTKEYGSESWGGGGSGGVAADDDDDNAPAGGNESVSKSVNNAADKFADVGVDNWFYAAVQYVLEHGLMNGVSDTTFSPNDNLTRAMLATMLFRNEGGSAASGQSPFSDVPDGQWYSDAVKWAFENGIASGYGGEIFGTNDDITREQLVVMLYNYAKWKGLDVSGHTDLSKYADLGEVSGWAAEAMAWAVAEGLITGRSDTELAPGGTATRAEAATLLMRFIEQILK